MRGERTLFSTGDLIGPLEVGQIAHGGHWVARHEGMVVFVRHALFGESVLARVTSVSSRFARADVVQVLRSSPHRRQPPCPIAGRCGGCDFQHTSVSHARELKRQVVAEQLAGAGVDFVGEVVALDPDEFGWRTRMRYHATGTGAWGLRVHRSNEVVPLPPEGCRIASPELSRPSRTSGDTLLGSVGSDTVAWVSPGEPAPLIEQRAAGRVWRVFADGFWQVHPQAAEVLVGTVVELLQPKPGERGLDLFCGVGLFAGALADRGVRVHGMEGDRRAARLAGRNVPEATFSTGDVGRLLSRWKRRADLVVLDPPRSGAGIALMERVLRLGARAIAYVACDPAALARDLRVARSAGWEVRSVRAFDLFPLTHHIEAVALLTPPKSQL